MQRNLLILTLGLALTLACTPGTVETDYQKTALMLPEGEADAGREVFVSLGCAACHTVSGAEDLPAPNSAKPGPELGLDAYLGDSGRLATSIVAPSHTVSAKYRDQTTDGQSPMRDFTSTMTIKQLSDLVAFLQRQGLQTQSKM
jgi:mono/diheme cytochrome c family protein